MLPVTYSTNPQVITAAKENNSLEQIMTLLQEVVSVVKNNNNNNNYNHYCSSMEGNRPERNRLPAICFACQQVEHYAHECPNQDRPVRNTPNNNQGPIRPKEEEDEVNQEMENAPNIRKEALKILRPGRTARARTAEFCLNKNEEGDTTSMYCEVQEAGISIDRPSMVMMVGVHGEQKRPLREIDEFPVTVGGKTITSKTVLMIRDRDRKIKILTEYCKPANIGDRIMRKPRESNKKSDEESDDESTDKEEGSEIEINEKEEKYKEEEGLISQTYLYCKFFPLKEEICKYCMYKGHTEFECVLKESVELRGTYSNEEKVARVKGYNDVFAAELDQLGRTSIVQHEIHTEEGPPIKRGSILCRGLSTNSLGKLAAPLYKLLKTEEKFEWKEEQQKAFEELKNQLISAPILAHPCDD
ncbi:hypothetical protein C2G38_2158851 [Gigaspora rosea]|uniref:CCHC-type domain-containing protein n=1 Tax=Gigaspora rosea TaxID=44941 RepID=A0A397W444_9GLOM|nr:hypothetical protein C2G38_2158851 [Gigaspora rosea]